MVLRGTGRTHLVVTLTLVLMLPALCHADVTNETTGLTYATVQAALDAAGDGDTLTVGAGTYNENPVISTPNITLQGDGSYPLIYCDTTSWTYTRGVSVKADGVTVRGFEITSNTPDRGYIVTDADRYSANWTVDDCIIHDVRSGVLGYGPNITVTDCHMYNMPRAQVRLEGSGPCTVVGNWIHSATYLGSSTYGIELTGNRCNSGESLIAYNYIAGVRSAIMFNGAPAVSSRTLRIEHNTIDGELGTWGAGTYLTQGIAFWDAAGRTYDPSEISIADNLIYRSLWYGLYNGEGSTGGLSADLPVENCLFFDNYWYYWPDYRFPEEWFGTESAAQAGWTTTGGDFTFDTSFTADPLFAKDQTNSDPEEYYALLWGSPALNAATDGTNIGAWQGSPTGPAGDDSPEPATWVLLACTGIAGAISRRRRAK